MWIGREDEGFEHETRKGKNGGSEINTTSNVFFLFILTELR